ncbi:alpha-hydroxy acid oxidase [Ectopseudomonas oleovorans]|uniref:Alpha-hydroxy-acid oxidizing protein n=1 Tax=Ectopseudomonas oleovorans TaxID=301 RepID=A0AA42QDR0_ECTOL|nr:alpha-hydroxy acid oxidase [Pseudomonas oleovorans]MDH1339293.1 alpha-hydroxy-acid oxidizing protein [Pseudomonas oleovorans]MDH1492569.1 alpha-hydroxy-acid oxidizing protein [Pseudomonas oleovorans]WGG21183.1 alpha-hydroxy-acid oxidizing protein [Pseudomonas oleovorans]
MRRFYRGRDLARVHSIAEMAELARRRLPHFAWEYLSGGAEDELTLQGNRRAFADCQLQARTLVPCHSPATTRTLFGRSYPLPLAIGPTGYNGMLHRDADIHLARAATTRGLPFCLSTVANAALEEIVDQVPGVDLWFQLYAMRDPQVQADLLRRAQAAGVGTLLLTSDAMVLGNREWDRRNFVRPRQLSLRNKLDVLRHPGWLRQVMWPTGLPAMNNLTPYLPAGEQTALGSMQFIGEQMDSLLDWEKLARIREQWPGRLLLKGVLHPADAQRAIDLGLDGIVISNHGGRQLDGALSTLDALQAIAPVARGRLTLLLDGGIRRGADIAKALALGADALLLGRASLYGVAVAGEAGASRVLDLLAEELHRTLNLMGCPGIDQLSSDWLAFATRPVTARVA